MRAAEGILILPNIIHSPQEVTHKLKTAIWCSTLTIQEASGVLIHDYLTIKVTLRENLRITWADLRLFPANVASTCSGHVKPCPHSPDRLMHMLLSLIFSLTQTLLLQPWTELHQLFRVGSRGFSWLRLGFCGMTIRDSKHQQLHKIMAETRFMWEHLVIESLWAKSHL